MRIALLADTHLPRRRGKPPGRRLAAPPTRSLGELPPGCLAVLDEAQLILHAGDICTAAVLAELAAIGPPLHAVCGNVDEPALRRLLPAELELELEGVSLAMTHDAGPAPGRLARMRRRFPTAAAVVFGHSHLPLHQSSEAGFQIFNPGSPTERRRAPHRTMGIAEVGDGSVAFRHVVL